ncbi:NAD(P)-binding protein [Acaromyces ingoldii]|uniref:NAD(P)-binding protein n=1 Tax=Acaromyces ingoldii TaxID=215250 RepID=A0A316YDP4_9BASI|nr:NAD(P)-binding protein [Acaromyces ingoldii]PWN87527.1 NAD(P)-binding protein [Acaromyces ingoldii]
MTTAIDILWASPWLLCIGLVLFVVAPALVAIEQTAPYSFKPYRWPSKIWSVDEIPNLTGKVALVTGANGGIGVETCVELVRNGAQVFMGCRSEEKFQKARNTIDKLLDERGPARDNRKKGQVLYFECDVSSLALAKKAATVFLAHPQAKRLDVAYFCAGAPSTWGARPLSEDGIDLIMATNCTNQLAMLDELYPLIKKTSRHSASSCRIIFISSNTEFWANLRWPLGVEPTFNSWKDVNDPRRSENARYAQSKLAQALLARKLSSDLSNENIACLALHPGEIDNDFVHRMLPWTQYNRYLAAIIKAILIDSRQGALTGLFAATAKEVDEKRLSGQFLTYPATIIQPSAFARNDVLGRKAWELQMDLIQGRNLPRC